MHTGYEVYCLTDPVFYDSPVRAAKDEADFEFARRPVPAGWRRSRLEDWVMYGREDVPLPGQGWKVHVSACLDNAEDILETVWDYCVHRAISFKFIRSADHLFLRNVKHADRGSSGKFVTIFPADEAELERVLRELGPLLAGQAGPYILSDLRWEDGPLYVRYGGFAERYCVGANGELELAIQDGDGNLIPDRRGPTFEVPPWAELPDCLRPHLEARRRATVDDLPYRIESALHFSNGGGVYLGVDKRTDEKVVLKEARPHAGLAMDGVDAVTRLRREREMLERLAGLDLVPEVHDYFTMDDHHFLVQEFIEGEKLSSLFVERYPLTVQGCDEQEIAAYTAWALGVYTAVERAVKEAHERDVVLGDLHPSNVLVRPDGRVVLIDLEGGWKVGEERRQTLADPGFIAPPDREGFEIDDYALACIRIYLFMPLTTLHGIAREKADELAATMSELFPVAPEFALEAARTIRGSKSSAGGSAAGGRAPQLEPTPAGWREARDSMAEAILGSATPNREDRLYPGDPKQFKTGGGINFANGAAGVLYALLTTGARRRAEDEKWLAQHALRPERGTPLGFYDGLHGAAYVLDHLGRRDDALEVLQICGAEVGGKWERLGLDLYAGLAGIGLNLAYFAEATGESALWDQVWEVTDVVSAQLGDEDSVPEVSGGDHPYAGLTRGSSGLALMFLRLYEHNLDGNLLDLAGIALRQDLRRCLRREDGSLEVNEGWRTMPYLADGSVGIGMVLGEYLSLRDDEYLAEAAAAIHIAAEAPFYIEPGLFWGRAGMILYHAGKHPVGTAYRDPAVAAQVRRLAWHAMTYEGHLAFPGDQLLRLSMDLATGTAGVLLALGSVLRDEPVHLPFLRPRQAERPVIDAEELVLVGERR